MSSRFSRGVSLEVECVLVDCMVQYHTGYELNNAQCRFIPYMSWEDREERTKGVIDTSTKSIA